MRVHLLLRQLWGSHPWRCRVPQVCEPEAHNCHGCDSADANCDAPCYTAADQTTCQAAGDSWCGDDDGDGDDGCGFDFAACDGVGMNACGFESSCTYHGTDVKCTVGPGTTCVSCSPCDADFPPDPTDTPVAFEDPIEPSSEFPYESV